MGLGVGLIFALAGLGIVLWLLVPAKPEPRNSIVVETGAATIERAALEMCGRAFPTRIRAGRVEGDFHGSCATGPTLEVESATVKYRCADGDGYNDPGLPAERLYYRLTNGRCVAITGNRID